MRNSTPSCRSWRSVSSICTRRRRPWKSARAGRKGSTPRWSNFAASWPCWRLRAGCGWADASGWDLTPICNDSLPPGPLPTDVASRGAVARPYRLAVAPLWGRLAACGGLPGRPAPRIRHRRDPQLERARPPRALPPVGNRRPVPQSGKRDHRGRQWLGGWQRRVRAERVSRCESVGARPESRFWRRLECRIPRREERHRGAAEQRHAGVAGFPCAAHRRLPRRARVRRLLPDLLSRPGQAARRNRTDAGLVAGWRSEGAAPHRLVPRRSVSVLLRRRRLLRLRPAKVPGAGRLRRTAGALLPGRRRPGLYGLEARLEGAVSAAQHRVSRAPRHYRQALQRSTNTGGAQEELPAVLLEEYP